jgi:hypothetical protein
VLRQEITWTCIPNGIADGFALVSVVAGIRLSFDAADGRPGLDDFPDVKAWPAAVRAQRFVLGAFAPGSATERQITVNAASPGDETWTMVFGSNVSIVSAGAPVDRPPIDTDDAAAMKSELIIAQLLAVYRQGLLDELGVGGALAPGLSGTRLTTANTSALDRAVTFLKRQISPDQVGAPHVSGLQTLQAKSFAGGGAAHSTEFHALLSSLGQYPVLQRRTGLVYDLRVPSSDLAGVARLRVRSVFGNATRGGVTTVELTPVTAVEAGNLPRHDDLVRDRMLNIGPGGRSFSWEQLEVLSEAFKAKKMLSARDGDDASQSIDNRVTSHGLSLNLHAIGARLKADQDLIDARVTAWRAAAANSGAPATAHDLTASQLTRGYTVDIRTAVDGGPAAWSTLCARDGTYTAPSGRVVLRESDEGWISYNATSTANTTVQIHDTLVRWDNKSLSATMPGLAAQGRSPHQLIATFEPTPGTLPRLRFGRTYGARLRARDLAGNAVAITQAPAGYDTPAISFTRFDPVAAPIVMYGTDSTRGPGDELLTPVIRTFNSGSADQAYPAEQTVRYVLPPRVSSRFAELHGRFDASDGVDPNAYDFFVRGDKTLPATYDPQHPLVYLPDPLCRGASLRVTVNGITKSANLRFTRKWPEITPWRIVVRGSDGPETVRLVQRELERELAVELMPAVVAELTVSSYIDAQDVSVFALWERFKDDPAFTGARDKLRAHFVTAQSKLLTPPITIKAVHAVQRPLIAPRLTAPTVARMPNGTSATVIMTTPEPTLAAGLSTLSASELSVDASWCEWTTPATGSGGHAIPVRSRRNAPVLRRRLDEAKADATFKHETDKRRRDVTYTFTTTSRFRAYFDAKLPADRFVRSTTVPEITLPSTDKPPVPDFGYSTPIVEWKPSPSGRAITRTRKGGSLRIFLRGGWHASGDHERLAVLRRSTAAPPNAGVVPFISLIGTDPVWTYGQSLKRFEDYLLPNAVEVADEAVLEQLGPDGKPLFSGIVSASAHDVHYDDARGMWFCDVAVADAGSEIATYMPFVRLSIARYQGGSLRAPNDVRLSSSVQLPFTQLLPDRTATVDVLATEIVVVVDRPQHGGATPQGMDSYVETTLERFDERSVYGDPRYDVIARRQTAGAGSAVRTSVPRDLAPDSRGLVNRAEALHRVTIREYERYADGGSAPDRRLVYADVVSLP